MRETFETFIEHPIATFFLWLMLVWTIAIVASTLRGSRRERRVIARPSTFKVTTRTERVPVNGRDSMRVYLNAELNEDMRVSRLKLHTTEASGLTRIDGDRTWVLIVSAEGVDFEAAEKQLRTAYPMVAPGIAKHFDFPGVMTEGAVS